MMLAIARAENRTCDPLRHNLSSREDHGTCIGSYGVLQVGCIHYQPNENRNDLGTNVEVAHRVYLERVAMTGNGYTAWTMYNNGTYKEFLE